MPSTTMIEMVARPAGSDGRIVGELWAIPSDAEGGYSLVGVFFLGGGAGLAGLPDFADHVGAVADYFRCGHRDRGWLNDDDGRLVLPIVDCQDATVPDDPAELLRPRTGQVIGHG